MCKIVHMGAYYERQGCGRKFNKYQAFLLYMLLHGFSLGAWVILPSRMVFPVFFFIGSIAMHCILYRRARVADGTGGKRKPMHKRFMYRC